MSELRKLIITDGTDDVTVNSDGHLDVVQHTHPDTGAVHFHIDGLTTGTTRYILVDLSDTTNYPHVNTTYAHLEWLQIEVDGTNAAEYKVYIGFLENVDATDGDRYIVKHVSGSRTAGQSIRMFDNFAPNGHRMRSESTATHMISLNDTNYQTDVNLPSTLDPSTSDTPSGSGDVILEIVVSAGTIDASIDLSYHSH